MSVQALPDLAQRLEDQGVGTVGTNIFPARMPPTPDKCVAIIAYPGDPNRLHGNDDLPVDERFNIQYVIRAAADDNDGAFTLANSVFDALAFRHETLNSGRRYTWQRANHMPALLDRDENDRPRLVINAQLARVRTTGL